MLTRRNTGSRHARRQTRRRIFLARSEEVPFASLARASAWRRRRRGSGQRTRAHGGACPESWWVAYTAVSGASDSAAPPAAQNHASPPRNRVRPAPRAVSSSHFAPRLSRPRLRERRLQRPRSVCRSFGSRLGKRDARTASHRDARRVHAPAHRAETGSWLAPYDRVG